MASADRRIWYGSASAARSCPTDQWWAQRRWPSPQTTSQPRPPPRHGHRGLGFWPDRLGLGWAGVHGARGQLADQRQRPVERQHPMLALVTRGQRSAAGPAPPRFDDQLEACAPRVCWPAVRHDGPLLVQEVFGNDHTSAGPICV